MKFTDAQFIEAIRAVAAEAPEYRYLGRKDLAPQFVYHRRDGDPGCLIGEALARLGVEQDVLLGQRGATALEMLPDFGLSDRLTEIANETQSLQDCGVSWGRCLHEFNAALGDPS